MGGISDRIVGVRLEEGVVLPENCVNLFQGLKNARGFYGSGADASQVTSMRCMFWESGFEVVDMGDWDVSAVEDFSHMFSTCRSLQQVHVANWKTSNAKDMNNMFNDCSSLTALDISGWDVSGVQNMEGLFGWCNDLQELDISDWDTSQVTDMREMFFECSNLASLDVSRWDVSSLEDANSMFSNCESLESIDVSAWNTHSIQNMNKVFSGCKSLRTIDLSGWDMSSAASGHWVDFMFEDCESLETISVGEKCCFSGWKSFPESTSEDHPKRWYSQTDHVWYDTDKIAERSGIADTYTNTEVPS